MEIKNFKLEIFVPETHLRAIQTVLHETGAGQTGRYEDCSAYGRVTGTWRPLKGAAPYLGIIGELSEEPEIKIEVNVTAENVEKTVAAIKAIHPYENPLINVLPLFS